MKRKTNMEFHNIYINSITILKKILAFEHAFNATAKNIHKKLPVSEGYALIMPKKHCSDYFELSFKEQAACWFMVNHVKQLLVKKYHPDGFNVGINVHATAGQTVLHVHIHLIHRYSGDVERPEGGVRGVIPEKKEY